MVGIVAVDHPVVLPDAPGSAQTPVWEAEAAALPAVAHRLRFPGVMVEVDAVDGLVALLCALADPRHPVHPLPADDIAAERLAAAAHGNGLTLPAGLPTAAVSLILARRPGALHSVAGLVARDQPGVLVDPGTPAPTGYQPVRVPDARITMLVPAAQHEAAQAAVDQAVAERAEPPPAWLNSGTAAALGLLARQHEQQRRREADLQEQVRRAYDQMREARDQMLALRSARRRRRR